MLFLKNQSLFELFYKFKYHSISSEYKDIIKIQGKTNDAFSQWQSNKKWEIVKHHFHNNTTYKKLTGNNLPEHWEQLPILDKSNFQNALIDNLSLNPKKHSLYYNKTSGSTGRPFNFAKDYRTQARVWGYKKYFFNLHGIDFNSLEARIYRQPTSLKAKYIQIAKDFLLRRIGFSVNELEDKNFEKWLQKFKKVKFEYIYGYTSAIVLFSRFLLKKGIALKDLCPSLKLVIVTSETCSANDKELITKAVGVPAVNEYGTADIGLIGYECQHGKIHICQESLLYETNESDEVIVTDLYNTAFPFIRYKLGDLVKLSNLNCNCGLNSPYLEELKGRVNDFIVLGCGKKISGYSYFQNTRPLIEKLHELKEYNIKQVSSNLIEFNIVHANDDVDDSVKLAIQQVTQRYLNKDITVVLKTVSSVERSQSGKLKHFERLF